MTVTNHNSLIKIYTQCLLSHGSGIYEYVCNAIAWLLEKVGTVLDGRPFDVRQID